MRSVLEQQLQEKAAAEQEHARHESLCFPANHTARQPEDTSRPWMTTTQFMSAQQEVNSVFYVPHVARLRIFSQYPKSICHHITRCDSHCCMVIACTLRGNG